MKVTESQDLHVESPFFLEPLLPMSKLAFEHLAASPVWNARKANRIQLCLQSVSFFDSPRVDNDDIILAWTQCRVSIMFEVLDFTIFEEREEKIDGVFNIFWLFSEH